jgi:Uma2 family endonuclease
MPNLALAQDTRYTWEDHRTWPDEERWELIRGEAYDMSPAPGTRHQIVALQLGKKLSMHFEGKSCVPFIAPVDVRLTEVDVVQPDLLVVCQKDKIKPTHIDGAPTLVVEILSPSTAVKDRGVKMELYARSGIREVWIVTPYPSTVEVYSLMEQGYRLVKAYAKEQTLKSVAFQDLEVPLENVFDFPLEPGEEVKAVREPPPPRYGTEPRKSATEG